MWRFQHLPGVEGVEVRVVVGKPGSGIVKHGMHSGHGSQHIHTTRGESSCRREAYCIAAVAKGLDQRVRDVVHSWINPQDFAKRLGRDDPGARILVAKSADPLIARPSLVAGICRTRYEQGGCDQPDPPQDHADSPLISQLVLFDRTWAPPPIRQNLNQLFGTRRPVPAAFPHSRPNRAAN